MRTLAYLPLAALVVVWTGASRFDQPSALKVLLLSNERVSINEAHFRLNVTNISDRPIFLTGIIYESESHIIPAYLEQEQTSGAWKTILPCLDTAPPQVIKLEPTGQIGENLVLKVPLEGVCKERNIRLEGRFRFRLDYFKTEEQARTYLKAFFSRGAEQVGAAVAISEPFRIPTTSAKLGLTKGTDRCVPAVVRRSLSPIYSHFLRHFNLGMSESLSTFGAGRPSLLTVSSLLPLRCKSIVVAMASSHSLISASVKDFMFLVVSMRPVLETLGG